MKRTTRTTLALGILSLPLVVITATRSAQAACADGVWEEGAEECDDGNTLPGDGCAPGCMVECGEVGAPATEHTCGHGAFGPFQSTSAQKYPGFVYSDVSMPHTYFTIALAGTAGVDHSGVLFNPGVTGAFAIYMKSKFPIAVRDSTGAEVPVYLEHAISSCSLADSLTWVKTYRELSTEDSYTLDIGPSDEATVSLALEYLPSFSQSWYTDADHDAWGGSLVGQSWCTVPPSYVRFGEDCDDADPAVNPDAKEGCDGVDANCDFSPDDSECPSGTACSSATHQCELPTLGEGGAGGAGGEGRHGRGGGVATPDAGAAGAEPASSGDAGMSAAGRAPAEPQGGRPSSGGTHGNPVGGTRNSHVAGKGGAGDQKDDEGDSGCQIGATRPLGSAGWTIIALALAIIRRRRPVA